MGIVQSYLYSYSITKSAGYVYKRYHGSFPIDDERVEMIEEHCVDLNSPMRLIGGKHSFLLLKTISGRKVRLEYSASSQEPTVIYNYEPLSVTEMFRSAAAIADTKVRDVVENFKKHAQKEAYNISTHNCQHVVRDTYIESCGIIEQMLRNDYLKWFKKKLPRSYKDGVMRQDLEHDKIVEKKKVLFEKPKLGILEEMKKRKEKAQSRVMDMNDFVEGNDELEHFTEEDFYEFLEKLPGVKITRSEE